MEIEIAGNPFVAHPLGIANNALIGVVNLPAFIDIAQHTALAIAHRAIGENVANALIIIIVDLQTLDEPNLLIALIANHTIAVEKTKWTRVAIAHRAIRRNAPNIVVIGIANGLSHTFRAHHRAACHQQNQYKKSKNLHCSVSYLSE